MARYFTQAGRSDVLVVDLRGGALQIHLPNHVIRETFGQAEGFLPLMKAVRDHLPRIERLAVAKAGASGTEVFLTTQDLLHLRNLHPAPSPGFSVTPYETKELSCNPQPPV